MAAQTVHQKKHSFYQDSSIPYLMNFKIMKKNSMLNIIIWNGTFTFFEGVSFQAIFH